MEKHEKEEEYKRGGKKRRRKIDYLLAALMGLLNPKVRKIRLKLIL